MGGGDVHDVELNGVFHRRKQQKPSRVARAVGDQRGASGFQETRENDVHPHAAYGPKTKSGEI